METAWDYTEHAKAYAKRPDYAREAIDRMVQRVEAPSRAAVADIGAGTGHLTQHLVRRGFDVTAVEPNDAMRAEALARFSGVPNVRFVEASAEDTGLPGGSFALVTFGSSFNVTDRPAALRETARLLAPGGWFACMWNHRDLDDPLQKAIEGAIRRRIPSYGYGARREDQTGVINASKLFGDVRTISGNVTHEIATDDFIEGWRSHATLARQAGDQFADVVREIAAIVENTTSDRVRVPYTTRVWMAQLAGPAAESA